MPKTNKFIPLNSRRADGNFSDAHQLAKLLVTEGLVESPDRLVPLAISQSLGSFLSHRLTQTQNALQDYSQIQALKAETRDNMVLHLRQERAMLAVNQALSQAKINCLWLDGVAVGYTVYPEAHLRVKQTLDCLISSDDIPSAVKILQSLNYDQADTTDDSYTHAHLPIILSHRQDPQLRLVLHQNMKGYSGRNTIPDERLSIWLNEVTSFDSQQQTFFTLKPEHQLLYLCAQGFLYDGQSVIGLIDLLDLHLLLTVHDLDWDELIAEAVDLQWTYLLAYMLNVVRDYFYTEIPPTVLKALQNQNKADQFMRRVVLNYHEDSQEDSIVQYFKQLSVGEKVKTAIQIIFPPKRYIRQRYAIRAKRATIPYYIYRILRYILSIPFAILKRLISSLRQAYQNRD